MTRRGFSSVGIKNHGLDANVIRRWLDQPELEVAVEASVGSTNTRLAERREAGETLSVLLAEHQSAGRGRHGRRWLSPPGGGLYLSMARELARPAADLTALSLVAGLAAADAVTEHSPVRVGLKWPNDLQVGGKKLGGCLIDLKPLDRQRCLAVIGIGINVDLGGSSGPEQPWTDLVLAGGESDRNRLAALVVRALQRYLEDFEQTGFEALRSRWDRYDVLRGRHLRSVGSARIEGRGMGVDATGALLLATADGIKPFNVGEISLKPVHSG